MTKPLILRLRNVVEDIPATSEEASRWLTDHGAPASLEFLANLVIEELATNCIKYGYDDSREHIIEITLDLSPQGLLMTIVDDGHPFNPLNLPEPDLTIPIEDRPIGGLGLHLLRQLADRMEYTRVDDRNQVTLFKASTA